MQESTIPILKLGWWLKKVLNPFIKQLISYHTLGKHYTRKGFNPNAPGLDSLQWDSAELLQIGVQDQMSYDDAFTIEEVWS